MTPLEIQLYEALKNAKGRVTHKLSCPQRPSNFQARQNCKCGRDEIVEKATEALAEYDRQKKLEEPKVPY